MADLTVTITETELKALKTVVLDPQEWTENAVKNRARIAVEKICENLLKHCNENSIALAIGQDAQDLIMRIIKLKAKKSKDK